MKCLRCKQKQLTSSSILHNRMTCFDGLLKCLHPIYVHVLMIDSLLQVNIGCTCIVCGEDYENSKPGETWVMCAAWPTRSAHQKRETPVCVTGVVRGRPDCSIVDQWTVSMSY